MASRFRLGISVRSYKTHFIILFTLEFMGVNNNDRFTYSESFNMLIRVREICLNNKFQIFAVLRNDKFRQQGYSTSGTSTSDLTNPGTEV